MKKSKHSLSNYKLFTSDMGELVPIGCYEALPGDYIQQNTSMLLRCSPLLSPVMHPVRVRIHHWFVPTRLIWDDFEDFITGGPDGTDSTTPPTISSGSIAEGSLADYLGIPPATYSPNLDFSALPFRAYSLIFNEHYRDQDLVTELTIDTSSGTDTTTNTTIQSVAWEKDGFTTSRPWEQKGSGVTIPLGTSADVLPDTSSSAPTFNFSGSSPASLHGTSANQNANWDSVLTASGNATWADPKLYADLSSATGMSIQDLRLALATQSYQENRARYGSRYGEYLRSLGVRSSDQRLHLPEYLGGGRQVIQFSEVLQTAEGTDPVGEMRGHGIAAVRSNRFRRFIEEHGFVITLLSVIPKTIYSQGLNKMWSREVKEDYFQREFQFIGEQAVLNKELYTEHTTPDGVFGYAPRYDEYRSIPSSIAGEFRSTLDHWHMAREFATDPALNSSFVTSTPTKRVFASSTTDTLYCMANHSIQARRIVAKNARNKII